MKKLLLVFSCTFSILLLAQETDKPYDFPVKPGTEQWARLTSSREMDEVCIIPVHVLKNLSTKALLITCLNYPRIIDFFLMDDVQSGYNFYVKHFNGLAELIRRPDLNKVLLQSYLDIDLPSAKIPGYDPKLTYIQIAFLELMLSQEAIINQYDKNEKIDLLSEAILKLEKRKSMGESLGRQLTTALILSRILNSMNSNLFNSIVNKEKYTVFNSYGFLLDTTTINEILVFSKEIKNN